MSGNIFDNNMYNQPIDKRPLKWAVPLIVIACVLLFLTLAILCILLPDSHVSIFAH